MKDSKLITVLKQFSTRERTKWKEYIFSPYFNKNQKVRTLCAYLTTLAPAFPVESMHKTAIFQLIFEEEDYQERRLNNVISDLLQLTYDYMAQVQYKTHLTFQKNLLLEALLRRKMYDQVERNAHRYQQLQQQSKFRNFNFFLNEYHLYDKLDRFSLTKEKRGYDENLQLKNNTLDQYYFANKLRIACDMASRNIVVNAGYQCHFLTELITQIQEDKVEFLNIPAISVYFQTWLMLTENKEGHYFEVKSLLAIYMPIFPQGELRTLYNYALNYCVKKINLGQSEFYREIFDLYKVLLEQKIILRDGHLTQWSYINIVSAGIQLKEFDFTEELIYQYKDYLLPQEKNNVFTYSLATLYFEKGDYNSALRQLHNVEFTDAFYHMAAKIIQLKSYYTLEETEPLFALIEASKKYITRNRQLSDYQKKSNSNFLKLVAKLYNVKLKQDYLRKADLQKQLKQVATQLQEPIPIANKNWLKEALGELRF